MSYRAALSGTTAGNAQKPVYQKTSDAWPLKITDYDPQANRFTVQLPIPAGSRDVYVLTCTADIIDRQAGGYSNSVRFDGGSGHTGSTDALDHAEQTITKNVARLLHVPPTGDDTPVFFFIALLSGTLLAMILFCLFTRSKKRLP